MTEEKQMTSEDRILDMIRMLEELEPKELTKRIGQSRREAFEKFQGNLLIYLALAEDLSKYIGLLKARSYEELPIPQEKRDKYLGLAEYLVRLRYKDEEDVKDELMEFELLCAACPSEEDMDKALVKLEEVITIVEKEMGIKTAQA